MYNIVTDACADLTLELIEKNDIEVVPMEYEIDGQIYQLSPKATKKSLSYKEFYNEMREKKVSKTTMITPIIYYETIKKYFEKGEDVLLIVFSSALSSSYNSALTARNMLLEEYKDRKVEVVDSLSATAGEGFLSLIAADLKRKNVCLEENANWLRENNKYLTQYFTVDDLMALQRGGRLGKGKAVIGTMVGIKPVLHISEEGKLIPLENVRGAKQSWLKLVDAYKRLISSNFDYKDIYLAHADNEEGVNFVKNKLIELFNVKEDSIKILQIGPVIGSHTSAGVVYISFFGKGRK